MYYQKKITLYNIYEASKILAIGLNETQLYSLLKEENVVSFDRYPNQEYIDKGLFVGRVKIQKWNNQAYPYTLVTEDGLKFIKQLYNEKCREKSQNFLPPKKPFPIEGYYQD